MKYTFPVLLGLIFCAPASTQDITAEESRNCWSSIIDFDEGANFNLLCIEQFSVESLTFFSNPNSIPTLCRQFGLVEPLDSEAINIRFNMGPCENGRLMGQSIFRCTLAMSDELLCFVDGKIKLTFKRERRQLYFLKD